MDAMRDLPESERAGPTNDFVRSLPLPLQLRVTEDLLTEIARKWTLGQSFAGAYVGKRAQYAVAVA